MGSVGMWWYSVASAALHNHAAGAPADQNRQMCGPIQHSYSIRIYSILQGMMRDG